MICRLCLEVLNQEKGILLFAVSEKNEVENRLNKLIAKHLQLEFTKDDTISTSVCEGCCKHLEDFHNFWILVDQKQSTLHEDLIRVKCDTELMQIEELNINTEEKSDEPLVDFKLAPNECFVAAYELPEINEPPPSSDEINHREDAVVNPLTLKQRKSSRTKRKTNKNLTEKKADEDIDEDIIQISQKKTNIEICKQPQINEFTSSKESDHSDHANDDDSNDSKLLQTKSSNETTTHRSIDSSVLNQIADNINKPIKGISAIIPSKDRDELIKNYMQLSCDLCGLSLDTFSKVRTHFKQAHADRSPYVKCCDRVYSIRTKLIEHISWHQNPDMFKCSICNKQYKNRASLKEHTALKHTTNDKITCQICQKKLHNRRGLKKHMLIHTKEKTYDCNLCDKSFVMEVRLREHIKRIHENIYPYVCDICGKRYKFKPSFKQHVELHQGIIAEPMQCDICSKWFKDKNIMRIHRSKHIEQHIKCDTCGYVAQSKQSFNHHMNYVHKKQKELQCTFCEKKFKRPKHLREHIAIHTGALLYNCKFCQMEFRNDSTMYLHIKRYHGEEQAKARIEKDNIRNPNLNKCSQEKLN